MKKYFIRTALQTIILFTLIILSMNIYAGETASGVLVVCYSRDGHTKMVAEKLAEKFNGDLEMLVDKKNRTGALGNIGAGNDALMHKTTDIEPLQHDPKEYDVILIGTPAWFSNMAPAARTFIIQNDLTGKTVGYFSTCHRVGADKATAQMANLVKEDSSGPDMQLPLTHKDLETELEQKINAFYEKVTSEANSALEK